MPAARCALASPGFPLMHCGQNDIAIRALDPALERRAGETLKSCECFPPPPSPNPSSAELNLHPSWYLRAINQAATDRRTQLPKFSEPTAERPGKSCLTEAISPWKQSRRAPRRALPCRQPPAQTGPQHWGIVCSDLSGTHARSGRPEDAAGAQRCSCLQGWTGLAGSAGSRYPPAAPRSSAPSPAPGCPGAPGSAQQ